MENKTLSMADAAHEVLQGKKRAILFSALWNEVRKVTKTPKEDVSNFYEDLTLDPRFVCLKDNKWDLKERRSFADSHIDVKGLSLDDSILDESDANRNKGSDDEDEESKKDEEPDSPLKKSAEDDYD